MCHRVATSLLYLPVALLGFFVQQSDASSLVNGGFEVPVQAPGAFVTISPGAEPAGFGWTIVSGSVDVSHIPNPFVDFPASEGNNGLDLNGTERGAIFQDFPTVPNQVYKLTFFYSDNPFEGGVSSASVDAVDVSTTAYLLSESISHSTATNGTAASGDGDADGLIYSNTFEAIGSLTRLVLTSTSASNSPSGGIFLDAVSVTAAALTGDFDVDGDVDGRDFLLWQRGGSPNSFSAGDLVAWQTNYGTGPLVATSIAVPEPSNWVLLSLAVVGDKLSRRRQIALRISRTH